MSVALGSAPSVNAVQRGALLADALSGLTQARKTLPCKWLYDPEGAALFEAITELPEYYPTRTERQILRDCAPAIAERAGAGAVVIEFGSGSAEKIGLLLDQLREPAGYVPVDIAAEWLEESAARLAAAYPGLRMVPVVADFTRPFALPPSVPAGRRLGFFPGSTIGNFTAEEAVAFLRMARGVLGAGAQLVLGADLVKDAAILTAAYDDAAGVTARFNLNLLHRLNRELHAGFDVAAFRHAAIWNPAAERIEMHLVAEREQAVCLAGRTIRFRAGESIHTENSHKYRQESLAWLAKRGGWRIGAFWTDPDRLFSVSLLDAD